MEESYFLEAMSAEFKKPPLKLLCRRFNFAFKATSNIGVAMSVVNELLEIPLSNREFYSSLEK